MTYQDHLKYDTDLLALRRWLFCRGMFLLTTALLCRMFGFKSAGNRRKERADFVKGLFDKVEKQLGFTG